MTSLQQRIEKVAAKTWSKAGGWNEEYCWAYLREEFTGSDEFLATLADRIEWALTNAQPCEV